MKTRSALIGAGVLILTAACGGVGGGSSDSPADKAVTTMGFGLPDEHATARVDAFKKAYPDVKVTVNEGSFDEQQFLSAVTSGNPPDVVYLDRAKIGTYAARGALQPMTSCVTDQKIDMSQYRDSAVQQVTYDGKVYGIPEFSTVRVMIVNNAAAKAAGIDPKTVTGQDWTALQRDAAKMASVAGGKVAKVGVDPRLPETLQLWAKANGVDMIAADGKSVNFTDPKVVQALEYAAGLVQQQGGNAKFSAFRDSWDFFGAKNEYAADQVGAMPIDSWYVNTLASTSPDVDVTIQPFLDKQGKPLSYVGGQAWALPKGSKHPEQACEWAKTMTATQTWITAAKARKAAVESDGKPYTGTFTANKAADEAIFSTLYDPKGNAILEQGVKVIQDLQDVALPVPSSPAAAEIQTAMTAAVNRVLTGQQSAQQALQQAQTEAEAALAKAGK